LWRSLDTDHTGTLSFTEFAPENALDLARFKQWAVETFGSMHEMYLALDTDGNGKVTFDEFSRACSSHGLPARLQESMKTLFLLVDDPNDYSSRGVITEDEIMFLDAWQCPVYLREKPDVAGRMHFQHALLERYGGNPLAAWRTELDKDLSMRVNFSEFTTACHHLARLGMKEANPSKGVPALYCAFDKNRQGWFALSDWDEPSHTALGSFVKHAKAKFGKVSECIRKNEEHAGEGVDLPTFRRGIKGAGLHSDDVVIVFDGLLPHRRGHHKEDSRLHVQDVLFLDKWRAEDDGKNDESWKRKAFKKMATWL